MRSVERVVASDGALCDSFSRCDRVRRSTARLEGDVMHLRCAGGDGCGECRNVGCFGGTMVCRALLALQPRHAFVQGPQAVLHLPHVRPEIAHLAAHVRNGLGDCSLHRVYLLLECGAVLGERGVDLAGHPRGERAVLLGKRDVVLAGG